MNPNRHLKRKQEEDEEAFKRQKVTRVARIERVPYASEPVGRRRFEEELEDELVRKKKKKRNMEEDREYGY
jgi:hypothetical protein